MNIWKLLKDQGGWITGAMMLGSMIGQGVMGSQKSKQAAKLAHKTGEEQQLQNFLGYQNMVPLPDQQLEVREGLGAGMDAAKTGGLFPSIGEAFSQRPSSPQLDAIAAQEKQLKNQALNTGTRGGLLRQQMFEASKNAASNKMNVMENARQNALQRAFQIFQPMAPTQAVNTALNQQQLSGMDTMAKLGVSRNQGQAAVANADAAGSGGGLGSILGGMDLSKIMGLFSPSTSAGGDPYSSLFTGVGAGMGMGGGFAT